MAFLIKWKRKHPVAQQLIVTNIPMKFHDYRSPQKSGTSSQDHSRKRSLLSRDHSRKPSSPSPSQDHSQNRSSSSQDHSQKSGTSSQDHSRKRSLPSRDHSRSPSIASPAQDHSWNRSSSQVHPETHEIASRDHSREHSASHRKHYRNGKSSSNGHKSTIPDKSHEEKRHTELLPDTRVSTRLCYLRNRRESDINGSGDSLDDDSFKAGNKNIRQRHVTKSMEQISAKSDSDEEEGRNRNIGSHKRVRPFAIESMRVTVQKKQKLTASRNESDSKRTGSYGKAVRTHTVCSAESVVKQTPKTKITRTEPSSITYASDTEYDIFNTMQRLFGRRPPLNLNYVTDSDSDSDRNPGLRDGRAPYSRDKRGSSNMSNNLNNEYSYKQSGAEIVPRDGNWPLSSAVGYSFDYNTDNSSTPHGYTDQSQCWRSTTSEDLEISSSWHFETITYRHEETGFESRDFDCEEIMAGRKNLNKNAISAFEEYGVQHRLPPKVEVVSSSGPPHRPLFIAVAKLGDSEICNEKGHSKHEARIKAAERALQMLTLQQDVKALEDSTPSESLPVESLDEDITNPVPYKDPVSALMEFAQFSKLEVNFDLISQEGPPHMPVFTMAVKLGDEVCPSVKGGSAKETKKRAACLALNKLKRQGALQTLFPDTKASTVPGGKLKSKSTLGAPGKNPVSVLNEYAQKSSTRLRFESSQTGPPHKPVFTVWAVLGEESFPEVRAASKKEGNVLAAEEVLKLLEERGTYKTPKAILGQPVISNNSTPTLLTHHDRVAAAAVRKFDELLLQTPESLVGRKVIAAIVMMDEKQGLYRVVSVGSGNRCVKGSHITHDGTVLHDSHAEVLARRGFKRFLYWLLKTRDLPILVPGRHGKQRFKDGISFHLYISTAPCGDGALFTHSDRGLECSSCLATEHCPVFSNVRTQGLLRAKQENGEGTIPVEPEFVGQTYDGIQQGGRLRVMSCSDKICQWNVLGLQGAILSSLYEPIYLQSITLGSLFNAGHLARAVCCRIDHGSARLQSQLPSSYHVNHPNLGVPSFQDPTRVVEKARSLSINWCFGDKEPEITDGTIGKTVKTVDKTVGPSRLCKKSLFDLYREICSKTCFTNISYQQVKLDADCYNRAKMALHKRLQDKSYGFWVCMPKEVDRFL